MVSDTTHVLPPDVANGRIKAALELLRTPGLSTAREALLLAILDGEIPVPRVAGD
jgi:hypothetical protein